ncbi:MAG: gluconate 2-dehydrogenase subunit 3 family protein [Pseudomonadales bacterium]|nr:gluconate 2-dehydrogenase subunit 3 family protein [Pseudomonadales bacterium]
MNTEQPQATSSADRLLQPIDRREMLRRVALMFGGALSAPAVLGVLSGCSTEAPAADAVNPPALQLLTPAQYEIVAAVADLMIPATDTPGALDVGVPVFIDRMLQGVYAVEHQQRFLSGLAALVEAAETQTGRSFLDLSGEQRQGLVQATLSEALASNNGMPPAWEQRPFILMVRELTLLGFFTSEIGATRVLQYDPVPGAFEACLPLAATGNGRTWATDTSLPF